MKDFASSSRSYAASLGRNIPDVSLSDRTCERHVSKARQAKAHEVSQQSTANICDNSGCIKEQIMHLVSGNYEAEYLIKAANLSTKL
jgi:hypothetical protein